jgi:hypothetical protein
VKEHDENRSAKDTLSGMAISVITANLQFLQIPFHNPAF